MEPAFFIYGILNLTPDSFSDGGVFLNEEKAFGHIEAMIEAGANGIDIGAESTRPGSDPVEADEQIRRLRSVLADFKSRFSVSLSLDTRSADVAAFGIDHGVDVINDVSALRGDQQMAKVVADAKVPVILMHMHAEPKTMQQSPNYDNPVEDISRFFKERIAFAQHHGIQSMILDPGIGFGKTLAHNLALLKHCDVFADLGFPLMMGVSRKSFIGQLSGADVDARLGGSVAANLFAMMQGVSYFRVHDVAEFKQAAMVFKAIMEVD
ncbi:MAG: dihydropteroate synthase [bacterium]